MKQRSLKFLAMLYRSHESHEYANRTNILASFNAIRAIRPLVTFVIENCPVVKSDVGDVDLQEKLL